MEAIFYNQWRDQNEETEYPFLNSSGVLPNGLVVDMSIVVPGSTSVALKRVRFGDELSLEFHDSSSGKYRAAIRTQGEPALSAPIFHETGRIAGTIVFGPKIQELAVLLARDNTRAQEYNDIFVVPSCVTAITTKQLTSVSSGNVNASGNVSLVEGDGIQIDGSRNDIVVNAVGKRKVDDCCKDNGVVLKTINGARAVNGGMLFSVRDIGQPSSLSSLRQLIRIDSVKNGIEFSLAT